MRLFVIFAFALLLLAGCQAGEAHTVPPSHPQYFDIAIELKNEKNDYIVETKVTLLMETSRVITLHFTLEEINTSNKATTVNNGTKLKKYAEELYRGKWSSGEEKSFEIPLYRLAKGEYNLRVQALTEENENGERWGGLATIYLKTNEDGEVVEKIINIVTDH